MSHVEKFIFMTKYSESGIDQFLFPKATIRKIVKPILQDKRIQPSSLDLINESAVLFLSYLTVLATNKPKKIKTLKEEDIKKCIEDIGFKAWLSDIDEMMFSKIESEANKNSNKQSNDVKESLSDILDDSGVQEAKDHEKINNAEETDDTEAVKIDKIRVQTKDVEDL
eukprot:NODE_519_length_7315_cov_0.500554.p4 type:complete len:168 gc:universal NODE_519_length_7315_cov_0.500554:135-638(+)